MSFNEISIIENKIKNLCSRIEELYKNKERDDETISYLTSLLCIVISGYIEKKFVEILKKYSNNKSSPQVANFISQSLRGTTNLNIKKITKIISMFKSEWGQILAGNTRFTEYESSLDYITNNRNIIAHGGNSSVRKSEIEANFNTIKDLLLTIERITN